MTLLRRPVPRTDEGARPFGAGQPLWMVTSQAYLVLFLLADFDIVKINPKPHFALSMLVLATIVLLAPRGLVRSMRVSMPVVVFVAWWMLSFVWTPAHGEWFNKSITQLSPLLIMTLIGSVLPWKRLIETWLALIYGAIAYTFAFTVLNYSRATTLTDASTGALVNSGWRGPFQHKNTLALFMVFGIVFVLAFEKKRRCRRCAVVLMVLLVALSRSGTGSACLATVLLSVFWCRRYLRQSVRKGSTLIVISFFGSIVGVGAIATFVPAILKLYGKDPTLTGRTEIWSAVVSAIARKPWTGYGWGGVWTDPTREPTFSIVRKLGFIVFHAHNGPLEIMIELGVIGLVVYLAAFGATLLGGWRLLRVRPALGEVVVSYCVLMFVASFSEAVVFGPWLALLVMLHAMSQRAKAEDDPSPRRRNTRVVAAMRELEGDVRSGSAALR